MVGLRFLLSLFCDVGGGCLEVVESLVCLLMVPNS